MHVVATTALFGKTSLGRHRKPKPTQQIGVDRFGVADEVLKQDHLNLLRREMGTESPDLSHIVSDLHEAGYSDAIRGNMGIQSAASYFLRAEFSLEIGITWNTVEEVLTVKRLHHFDGLSD
jgi:hypothetical protein